MNNLQSLRKYIDFNKENKEAHYKEYRPIVYGAIINRAYSSWETFAKELFYEYFLLKKEEYIGNGTFIRRYKIHELPAYLLENIVFDPGSETFSIKLDKNILVFTNKNIELKELNNLYSKIDVPIINHIEKSEELKILLDEHEFPLSIDNSENKIARALKYIITERNRTAHNSEIDDYHDMSTLEEWVIFFEKLGFVVFKTILIIYANHMLIDSRVLIGPCKQIVGKTIACFDIEEGCRIKKSDLVYVYRGNDDKEELIDILVAKSFKVEGQDKDYVHDHDKAGCNFESIIFAEPKIKVHYKYYIFKNSCYPR